MKLFKYILIIIVLAISAERAMAQVPDVPVVSIALPSQPVISGNSFDLEVNVLDENVNIQSVEWYEVVETTPGVFTRSYYIGSGTDPVHFTLAHSITESKLIEAVPIIDSQEGISSIKYYHLFTDRPLVMIIPPAEEVAASQPFNIRVEQLSAVMIERVDWYELNEDSPGEFSRSSLIGSNDDIGSGYVIEHSLNEDKWIEAVPVVNNEEWMPSRLWVTLNSEIPPVLSLVQSDNGECDGLEVWFTALNQLPGTDVQRVEWYELIEVDENVFDRVYLWTSENDGQDFPLRYHFNGQKIIEGIPVIHSTVHYAGRVVLNPDPWIGVLGGMAIGSRTIITPVDAPVVNNTGEIKLLNHTGTVSRWEYSTNGQVSWQTWGPAAQESGTLLTYVNLQTTTSFRAWVSVSNCGQVSELSSVPATVAIVNAYNTISSWSFDLNEKINAESKSIHDGMGRGIQSLSKDFVNYNRVVSEPLFDVYGRNIGNTMAAPAGSGALHYQPSFITAGGQHYSYKKFDLESNRNSPVAVDKHIPNTLGWYYSNNNTLGVAVPRTSYPYSRLEYYDDGTSEVKRANNVGEAFRFGSGHESFSATFPVISELDYYAEVRSHFWTDDVIGNNFSLGYANTVQSVSQDADGKEYIEIRNTDGQVLMTARYGNVLTVSTDAIQVMKNEWHYFYMAQGGVFTSTASVYKVYNLLTNTLISSPVSLPKGFYRYICESANSSVSYTNAYQDISFYFYNQLNQLLATVSPEGTIALVSNGYSAFATIRDVPYVNTYEYDLRGRTVAVNTTDAGRTEYVYRKDGSLRFSQNEKQRNNRDFPFSYINYDSYGRILETGEYYPGRTATTGSIYFDIFEMADVVIEDVNQEYIVYQSEDAPGPWYKDVLRYRYDDSLSLPPGLSSYTQEFLNGNLAFSMNISSGTQSWYSYDEQGRLKWMIQQIPGLGERTLDYTYDYLGNLSKAAFQKNNVSERYFHHYFYDRNNRLSSVFAGKQDHFDLCELQARYEYYDHGPLRRMILGDNTQGIDYEYTAQGWLKSINNVKGYTFDPGMDGASASTIRKDAFALNLDYYPDDCVGCAAVSLTTNAAPASYTGRIRTITWKSEKPAAVVTAEGPSILDAKSQTFYYDDKDQLESSVWATPNFSNSSLTLPVGQAYAEKDMYYDANGNRQSLKRYDRNGSVLDNFTYSYTAGTNKLAVVPLYAEYGYDELGQMTFQNMLGSPGTTTYIEYNSFGLVERVFSDAAHLDLLVQYTYNERGHRIKKEDIQLNATTYYVPDMDGNPLAVYNDATLSEIPLYASSRIGVYYPGTNTTSYELSDHLGNVRVVIDRQSGQIRQYNDYYPSGLDLRNGGDDAYRHGYQGQFAEKDRETGWSAFQLRMYDARIARWTTTDPYGQYHSPYMGMGNNPVGNVDPDGGWDGEYVSVNGGAPYKISNVGDDEGIDILYLGYYRDGGIVAYQTYVDRAGFWMSSPGSLGRINSNQTWGAFQSTIKGNMAGLKMAEYFAAGSAYVSSAGIEGLAYAAYRTIGALAVKEVTKRGVEVTAHGAERIAGAAATRGGVLTVEGVNATRSLGRVFTQADGAKVFIHEVTPGRFNVIIQNQTTGKVITTMSNWSQKSINRIAKNYGWPIQ